MLVVYADHIEAPLARRWKPAQIIPRDCGDLPALVPVHRGFSRLHVACAARLHFNEAQNIFFPSDQIDLSAAAGRSEISRDHGISHVSQVEVGGFFAFASHTLVGGSVIGRQSMSCQPVENAEGCMGGSSGEHRGFPVNVSFGARFKPVAIEILRLRSAPTTSLRLKNRQRSFS